MFSSSGTACFRNLQIPIAFFPTFSVLQYHSDRLPIFLLCISICLASSSSPPGLHPVFDHVSRSLTCALESRLLLLTPICRSGLQSAFSSIRTYCRIAHSWESCCTRMHGFQSLLSSQPTSNPFLSAWSLLFPSLFSCFSFRVWYQTYCNSIRDLTWAALSLCNAFFPPFLPLPVPHLLKDYLLREASLTTQGGFSALIST